MSGGCLSQKLESVVSLQHTVDGRNPFCTHLETMVETIVCWYLQGNRVIAGLLGWCEMGFVHHSIVMDPQKEGPWGYLLYEPLNKAFLRVSHLGRTAIPVEYCGPVALTPHAGPKGEATPGGHAWSPSQPRQSFFSCCFSSPFSEHVRCIGVLFGCFARKVDGDSWFARWFPHLPGTSISLDTCGQIKQHSGFNLFIGFTTRSPS